MKIAIIGSRNLTVTDFSPYIPDECTEIISGGAKGIDTCAKIWAQSRGIPVTEYLPAYDTYGRAAPHVRNRKIVDEADAVMAFWDGASKGTAATVAYAKKQGKTVTVISFSAV